MNRFAHLFAAVGVGALLTSAMIVACGAPATPSEMPRLAPRPEPVDPTAAPVLPGSDPPDSLQPVPDGGVAGARGPISSVTEIRPTKVQAAGALMAAPDAGAGPTDAGSGGRDGGGAPDSGAAPRPPARDAGPGPIDAPLAPLPPVPDGSVPADSRMEPILRRE